MLQIARHGGRCCGIHHIYGFSLAGDRVQEDLQRIDQWLINNQGFYQGRTLEIVLNESQCREGQDTLLPGLAERGFVLTSAFYNTNSGNNCYVFHRVNDRLPMNNLPFNWTGQIMSPSLRGSLDRITQTRNNNNNVQPLTRQQAEELPVGATLQYTGSAGSHRGATFRLERRFSRHDATMLVRKNATGGLHTLLHSSFCLFPVQEHPQPNQQFGNQRFEQDDVEIRERVVHAAPVVHNPAPVATLYYNRFQDGRAGGMYESLEDCRAAAPRCLTRMRKTIFSDGTSQEEEV